MRALIRRSVYFDAAHHLPGYNGACSRVHGHTWKIEIAVSGAINPKTGIAVDFKVLKKFLEEKVVSVYDHQDLNGIIKIPTAENLGKSIFGALKIRGDIEDFRAEWVKVWESKDSCCQVPFRE